MVTGLPHKDSGLTMSTQITQADTVGLLRPKVRDPRDIPVIITPTFKRRGKSHNIRQASSGSYLCNKF